MYSVDLKSLSKKELTQELTLAREWLQESQGDGFTAKEKQILKESHTKTINKIQQEISTR
jgi:hypothetical protein